MCGIISQETFRREYPEEVVGTFTKEGAEPALLIKDRSGDVSLILSINGENYKTFWTGKGGAWLPSLKQLSEAYKYLDKHGYTEAEKSAEQETPAPTAATTYDQQSVEDTSVAANGEFDRVSPDIFVQGRSLKQWEEMSTINEALPHSMHAHPTMPTDRKPTEVEFTAYINSLDMIESFIAMQFIKAMEQSAGATDVPALA